MSRKTEVCTNMLERITRVASVELTGKRDDVLDQAHAAIGKAKSK